MAVEAGRLTLFSPQLLAGNRQMMMMMMNDGNNNNNNSNNVYNAPAPAVPMGYGMPPLSGTTTETPLPMYGSGFADSVPAAKTALKPDDSGLTYSIPVSRKRSRDAASIDNVVNPLVPFPNAGGQNLNLNQNQSQHFCNNTFSFLGEDISLQIQQQQLEIDRFIAHHTEKVRMDIEERRKRNSRRIIAAVEEVLMKRLRSKEKEIAKIGKLNWALEEKVRSLCVENQIWRELAQTNEATANALRSNLKQVLAAQIQDEHRLAAAADDAADDAQSCCESNLDVENVRRGDNNEDLNNTVGMRNDECTTSCHNNNGGGRRGSGNNGGVGSGRWCRNCGKDESCVLLLPCRHLCLCTVCASSINVCPVCNSAKNASVHVNLS